MCGDFGFSNGEYEITLRRPPSMDYGLDRFLFSIFFSYFFVLVGWFLYYSPRIKLRSHLYTSLRCAQGKSFPIRSPTQTECPAYGSIIICGPSHYDHPLCVHEIGWWKCSNLCPVVVIIYPSKQSWNIIMGGDVWDNKLSGIPIITAIWCLMSGDDLCSCAGWKSTAQLVPTAILDQ